MEDLDVIENIFQSYCPILQVTGEKKSGIQSTNSALPCKKLQMILLNLCNGMAKTFYFYQYELQQASYDYIVIFSMEKAI